MIEMVDVLERKGARNFENALNPLALAAVTTILASIASNNDETGQSQGANTSDG